MKKVGIVISIIIILIGLFFAIRYFTKSEDLQLEKWNSEKGVNQPEILTGMVPVYFPDNGENIEVATNEMLKGNDWYDYENQEWANIETQDGSLWVWIPRYAYKITYIDETDKSKGGTIDIMFLKGLSNMNKDGEDVTKLGYTVHPAFENGNKNEYVNGEWNKKLTGIWVAKFEAGYAGQEGTASEGIREVETDISYRKNSVERAAIEELIAGTKITYPVFIGKTYSYNWLEIDEMYEVSRTLANPENPYGLDEKDANTHMMKNSEWGAVAYLSYSKYGTNREDIAINNVSLGKVKNRVTTVTGYGSLEQIPNYVMEELASLPDELPGGTYAWYTDIGQFASTTRNKYGIFDMRGGLNEYVAGYSSDILQDYGSFTKNQTSNELIVAYKSASERSTMIANYDANLGIYGDAVAEISQQGLGYTSWGGQTSIYIESKEAVFLRGGEYSRGKFAGLFSFNSHSGHATSFTGFRAVIVSK